MNIKNYCTQALQPVFDSMTKFVYESCTQLADALPSEMSDEQKLEIIKPMIDGQAQSLSSGFKSLDMQSIIKQAQGAMNGK